MKSKNYISGLLAVPMLLLAPHKAEAQQPHLWCLNIQFDGYMWMDEEGETSHYSHDSFNGITVGLIVQLEGGTTFEEVLPRAVEELKERDRPTESYSTKDSQSEYKASVSSLWITEGQCPNGADVDLVTPTPDQR